MADNEKKYIPEEDEEPGKFVRRIIAEQPDREPLHIVEQLVDIAVGVLKGRSCQISATVSLQHMKVTLCHRGEPIEERMILLMGDHTDRVEYRPDSNDSWQLIIRRDIPPLFVTRR